MVHCVWIDPSVGFKAIGSDPPSGLVYYAGGFWYTYLLDAFCSYSPSWLNKIKKKRKKDTTNLETNKQFYLQLITEYPLTDFCFCCCCCSQMVRKKPTNTVIVLEGDHLWYCHTRYRLYKLFLTWSMTTLFWCRTLYDSDQRWKGDRVYLGSRPCSH